MYAYIYTYIYVYITSDTSKRQRIKYWPHPVQCGPSLSVGGEAAGKGKPLVPWCGRSLIPSHQGGCLGRHCSRAGTGGSSRMGAGPDWDGDQGGCDKFPASRVPSDAPGIPCCSSAFPGKEGLGERRRGLVPLIKFYTSLYCFSGCFQTQKIQEIYSQMFPCLFVDSV